MNRIIKFKVKSLNNNQWGIIELPFFGDINASLFDWKTLVQFTERTDTNGQEIYHKDIVDYKGQQAIIEWTNDKWMVVSTNPLHVSIPLGAINGKDLKVIGNEYEGIKEDNIST